MVPSTVAGGGSHSSSGSGVCFQGSSAVGTTHMSSSFVNSSNYLPGSMCPNLGQFPEDASNAMFNCVASSCPSVGERSLVTDANSELSGGPNLQRSANINTDSYMCLPASPMSFSSNNISMSGTPIIDGMSVVQQRSFQDLKFQQMQQNQQQGASSITSLPPAQIGQVSLPNGTRFTQDTVSASHVQKKPRLDIKHEEIMQKQFIQQILHRQDSMQFQASNPQMQALVHQQRLRQQQKQLLQSMPPEKQTQLLHHHQQQQQMQVRQELPQQGLQSASCVKRPNDVGVCSRRLMQYLYHQCQRPPDNTIAYWRKFVAEYYSPRAKKRWCLSLYDNNGHHSCGILPQAAVDTWQCDMCGSKSGWGFETTFEVLPRLHEIKFGSGVIDELLFLDLPNECRFPSGLMMLEYGKAVQESVYEQLRVVHEGQLRIIFTADLKILCWEFCVRRHEDLIPRRLIAPQVNQLLKIAQKCQSTNAECGSGEDSLQELRNHCNMFVTAGRQIARSLESPLMNDLGFSKQYLRCLQISEVVNSMKGFMDFCGDQYIGPIEGMKNISGHSNPAKLQLQKVQELEKLSDIQGFSTDQNTVSKLVAQHHGLNNQQSNNHQMASRGALGGSNEAAFNSSNYQNQITRRNSISLNLSSQKEPISSFNKLNQSPSSSVLCSSLQDLPKSNVLQPQQYQSGNSFLQLNHSQTSHSNQVLQQHMIQKLLQNISKGNTGSQYLQTCHSGQSAYGSGRGDKPGFGTGISRAETVRVSGSGGANGSVTTKSNRHGTTSDSRSSAVSYIDLSCEKAMDMAQNMQLSEQLVQDVVNEFMENGYFSTDLKDGN